MKIKTKIVMISVIVFLLFALSFSIFYFTRPLVVYVSSSFLPSEYEKNLAKPRILTARYRARFLSTTSNGLISNLENAHLLILDPFADIIVPDGIKTSRWGIDDTGSNIVFTASSEIMWQSVLSSVDGKLAFLYPEGNMDAEAIVNVLNKENPNIIPIPYAGRISGVNYQDILASIEKEGISDVLLFEPESAFRILDAQNIKFYVDFRDYAALKGMEQIIGIIPDWNKAITDALALDSGEVSFDFTLTSTH